MARRKKQVVVNVFGGVIDSVEGLPKGYGYRIKDLDVEESMSVSSRGRVRKRKYRSGD